MTARNDILNTSRELRFVVDPSNEGFATELARAMEGRSSFRTLIVSSADDDESGRQLAHRLGPEGIYHVVSPAEAFNGNGLQLPDGFPFDVIALLDRNSDRLSAQLAQLCDIPPAIVLAAKTAHHSSMRPLFLISIPKSGTHLLYELANAFGYRQGITFAHEPLRHHWYCVEYSNSHTVARDFFVDTVRRSPFGNRHHPFMRTPALFIYRNPLDIWVSEANYYDRPGKTAFAGYLAQRSFEERLSVLLGEDWLLGSLRQRVGGFIPWISLPNVAALSFEELIGNEGGGSDALQLQLIWSLQLKLHVAGTPDDYARKVFNRGSATFNEGRIGNFLQIPADLLERFFEQPQDFMFDLGYRRKPDLMSRIVDPLLRRLSPHRLAQRTVCRFPSHADALRRKPMICAGESFDDTPIMIQSDYLGYNILRFRKRFLGVPQRLGPIDLGASDTTLPPDIVSEKSVTAVRFRIQQRLGQNHHDG